MADISPARSDAGAPVIVARGVHKHYGPIHAVDGVDLEVRSGELFGLIGHNGAGKSTMLKHLAGIMTPTLGRIDVRGRLSALIEVGAGFHQDLTGRENVYLSGAILGMSRAEVARKFDAIVDFGFRCQHDDGCDVS